LGTCWGSDASSNSQHPPLLVRAPPPRSQGVLPWWHAFQHRRHFRSTHEQRRHRPALAAGAAGGRSELPKRHALGGPPSRAVPRPAPCHAPRPAPRAPRPAPAPPLPQLAGPFLTENALHEPASDPWKDPSGGERIMGAPRVSPVAGVSYSGGQEGGTTRQTRVYKTRCCGSPSQSAIDR
jgi:hypothetical protein